MNDIVNEGRQKKKKIHEGEEKGSNYGQGKHEEGRQKVKKWRGDRLGHMDLGCMEQGLLR